MRTRQTMTISLPPEMIADVEKVRTAEHRTRSELVREALRTYFSARYPVVAASPDDLRALRRARREHALGQYVTLDQLHDALGSTRRPVRRKTA
jgi:Arc/MetJ-type ribon-helix-helix transcriptional regulator